MAFRTAVYLESLFGARVPVENLLLQVDDAERFREAVLAAAA